MGCGDVFTYLILMVLGYLGAGEAVDVGCYSGGHRSQFCYCSCGLVGPPVPKRHRTVPSLMPRAVDYKRGAAAPLGGDSESHSGV